MTPGNGEHIDPLWHRITTTATADLSSRERSMQADAMFAQIGALSKQCAALATECQTLRAQIRTANGRADGLSSDVSHLLAAEYARRTFWQRLRWLVRGR